MKQPENDLIHLNLSYRHLLPSHCKQKSVGKADPRASQYVTSPMCVCLCFFRICGSSSCPVARALACHKFIWKPPWKPTQSAAGVCVSLSGRLWKTNEGNFQHFFKKGWSVTPSAFTIIHPALVNLKALVLCFSFVSITNTGVILNYYHKNYITVEKWKQQNFLLSDCWNVHKEEVSLAVAHTQYKSFASVVFQLSWTPLVCCFSAWRTSTSGTWSCWATRSASSRVSTT